MQHTIKSTLFRNHDTRLIKHTLFFSRKTPGAPYPPPKGKENSVPDNTVATSTTVLSSAPDNKENFEPQQPLLDSNLSNQTPVSLPKPLPTLHSFDSLEMTVDVKREATPIEALKTRFVKHVTLKPVVPKKVKKPAEKDVTMDATTILSQDELSQPGLAPGTYKICTH